MAFFFLFFLHGNFKRRTELSHIAYNYHLTLTKINLIENQHFRNILLYFCYNSNIMYIFVEKLILTLKTYQNESYK